VTTPSSGDLLWVTHEASVQFTKPIRFRVIRVLGWITCDGWVWLDGYQLDVKGDAVVRRSIFVQKAGLVIHRAFSKLILQLGVGVASPVADGCEAPGRTAVDQDSKPRPGASPCCPTPPRSRCPAAR